MDLQKWQEKMKATTKESSFDEFLLHVASRFPIVLYRNGDYISKFPPTDRSAKILHHEKYAEYSDGDIQEASVDYDIKKSFFDQFEKLWKSVYLPNLISFWQNTNADYGDTVLQSKNIYLSFGVIVDCENIMYSFTVKDGCRNIYNSCFVMETCENVYNSIGIAKSYNIFYSHFVSNSANIRFSSNLIGCSECIFCNKLQNTSYCINNTQLDKEQYFAEKEKILSQKLSFDKWKVAVSKLADPIVSDNVSGNCIIESENIQDGQFVYHIRNGKNIMFAGTKDGNQEVYNCIAAGSPYGQDMYNSVSINGDNIYCCVHCAFWTNTYYSYYLNECSYCLWCIGLKNKHFCILNKQYTKKEWFVLVEKIFAQMEKEWILWDFFPWRLCPFYINDTVGWILWKITKQTAIEQGYIRRDEGVKTDISWQDNVVTMSELDTFESQTPERSIDTKVLDYVIADSQWNCYKILEGELNFLLTHKLPLPRKHRLDRMKENFRLG